MPLTAVQLEKRRRVMRRSMALGHCICNVQQPCPCDVFKNVDLCPCAGERPPSPAGEVRLTAHVRNAGCASKIDKKTLHDVLAGLPETDDPRVLVGAAAGDDAGVVMLGQKDATVLTVDVFTPSVDDPYTFGRIAAANSVSDVYAMGASPQAALSLIGFPVNTLPAAAMHEILRGGIDAMREAGVPVVGGHSWNDEEVKCGFAVVGAASAGGWVRNAGAKPGDAAVLTKPLGTGIVAFAHQIGMDPPGAMDEAAASMAALNRTAGGRMKDFGAHAATDVTGFSLLGHLVEIVKNSGVEVDIDFDAIPLFAGVADLARRDVLPGAVERNREAVDTALIDLSALAEAQKWILFGPETSGGLVVFLPADRAGAFADELRRNGAPATAVIGRVTRALKNGLIRVSTKRAAAFSPLAVVQGAKAVVPSESASCCSAAPSAAESSEQSESPCCANAADAAPPVPAGAAISLPPAVAETFAAYMAAVNAPGALSAREKKLISIALSVLAKCEPCVKINTKAALDAGATAAQVSEAAALGVAFSGAPGMMFYKGLGPKTSGQ
jgi:selenide, water dikinase